MTSVLPTNRWNSSWKMVSNDIMQKRWRLVLPVVGLIVFGFVSYNSLLNPEALDRTPARYVWWSNLRLDSDPLHKLNWNSEWEPTERLGGLAPGVPAETLGVPRILGRLVHHRRSWKIGD